MKINDEKTEEIFILDIALLKIAFSILQTVYDYNNFTDRNRGNLNTNGCVNLKVIARLQDHPRYGLTEARHTRTT